jgi:hypothetical protein
MLIWNKRTGFIRVQTTGQLDDLPRFERFSGGFQNYQPEELKNIGIYSESSK